MSYPEYNQNQETPQNQDTNVHAKVVSDNYELQPYGCVCNFYRFMNMHQPHKQDQSLQDKLWKHIF